MAVRQVIGRNPMGGPLPPGVTGYRSRDGGPWEPVYHGERRSEAKRRATGWRLDPGPAIDPTGGYPPGLTREQLYPQLPGVWGVREMGGVWYSAGGERIGRSLSGHMASLWLAYKRGQLGTWLAEHDRGTTAADAIANATEAGTRAPEVIEHESNMDALAEATRGGGAGAPVGDVPPPLASGSVAPPAAVAGVRVPWLTVAAVAAVAWYIID